MDDSVLAIMARMDYIRDDVTDIRLNMADIVGAIGRHGEQLVSLERITGEVAETMECVSKDIKDIKSGPVYGLDHFITKRVAQFTGGLGLFGVFLWTIIVLFL